MRLSYKSNDGKTYILNIMDTPGHVDFSYEVSRSLAACEGSLLIVDSTQGVEAQTLANAYQAINNDHEILPVLNKIDLPSSEPDKIKSQIEDVLGIETDSASLVSAKTGVGIEDLLNKIITLLPSPSGEISKELKWGKCLHTSLLPMRTIAWSPPATRYLSRGAHVFVCVCVRACVRVYLGW